jgi:tetratricopeptide (TPR) repeat protein
VESLLRAGRMDDAQKLAAQLEASYPDRADLSLLAGRALLAQGRMRAATEACHPSVGWTRSPADAYFLLGFAALRTGELERASRAWEAFLRGCRPTARRDSRRCMHWRRCAH